MLPLPLPLLVLGDALGVDAVVPIGGGGLEQVGVGAAVQAFLLRDLGQLVGLRLGLGVGGPPLRLDVRVVGGVVVVVSASGGVEASCVCA